MVNTAVLNVQTGKIFSLPAASDSNFKNKHGALSILSVDDSGKFLGSIMGNKHQLVLDIKQTSVFSIDGKKISLNIPEGVSQARYIISYEVKESGGIDMKVKMDFQDVEVCRRTKFDPISFNQAESEATLNISEEKSKRDLIHSVSSNGTFDALGYIRYKSEKVTTGDSQKSQFKTVRENQDKPIIENRGRLTTNVDSKEAGLSAFPALESAEKLNESFILNPNSVADEIDNVKAQVIDGINSSRCWEDVSEAADSIALLHGKPTYTKDVDTYASKFIKPEYYAAWENAGLDPSTLHKDMQILAKLPVLGEANNPVKIMRGGRFSQEEKQQYLFPIPEKTVEILNEKLAHLPKSKEYAEAIEGKGLLGTAGLLLRSISAMDQPRPWRKGNEGCDEQGKFTSDALIAELRKDTNNKGYNSVVTEAVINVYMVENNIAVDKDSKRPSSEKHHSISLNPA